jgi:hypothetical protein
VISPLLRFTGAAAATLAAVCAAGAIPTSNWGGSDAVASMAIAAGACLVGAVAGWWPLARVSGDARPERRVPAVLMALGLRMGVTLTVVAVLLASRVAPSKAAFLAWVGIDYAALLALESWLAVREIRRLGPNGGSASA